MGPSGAGKTTFLSILAGKVAKTDGSIKVNGKEQTLSLWKKLIGFVPQEDVMLSDLSVREILMVRTLHREDVFFLSCIESRMTDALAPLVMI
jgi:ABC-type multidrug transport system ATPase subunit